MGYILLRYIRYQLFASLLQIQFKFIDFHANRYFSSSIKFSNFGNRWLSIPLHRSENVSGNETELSKDKLYLFSSGSVNYAGEVNVASSDIFINTWHVLHSTQ